MNRKARKFVEHGGQSRVIAGVGLHFFARYFNFILGFFVLIALSAMGFAHMAPFGALASVAAAGGKTNVPIVTAARPEFIGDISYTGATSVGILPTNGGLVPGDRFMFGMILQMEGRITNAASNNPTGVTADQPFALVDTATISGYHRIRKNNEVFYQVRGPEIYELSKIYSTVAPYWNNVASSGGSTTQLSTTASATNDYRFALPIVFPPECLPIQKQVWFLLDCPNYDRLTLTLNFGDDLSVFTYGTRTAPTFTAYNSASGTPRCRVTGIFAQAGPTLFGNVVPGRVFRTIQENTTGDILNTKSASRQFNLKKGYLWRSALLKTGVKSTATTGNNSAYTSLSDTIYANIYLYRGTNKLIRLWCDYFGIKETDAQLNYASLPDKGYALIDTAPHGTPKECVDTSGLVAGPTGDVDWFLQSDIVGASNQAALILEQELRFTPTQAQ
jgi:hypothetical protein